MTDEFIQDLVEWCKIHNIELGSIPQMYENGLVNNRKALVDRIAERVFEKSSYVLFMDFAHQFDIRYALLIRLF